MTARRRAHDIEWESPARRAIERLSEKVSTSVIEFIYGPLAENPHRVGKPLHFDLAGLHSARRGDYRIVYLIDEDARTVSIIRIEHRSHVYRRR